MTLKSLNVPELEEKSNILDICKFINSIDCQRTQFKNQTIKRKLHLNTQNTYLRIFFYFFANLICWDIIMTMSLITKMVVYSIIISL